MSLPAAWALAEEVARGELSARAVAEAALSRTDLLIGADGVGAFLHVDADQARRQADQVDQRRARGEPLPLAGVPVALKDNLADRGQPLGCASLALRGLRAERTATAVARLQQAGAVIIGRTNMDELAMGSSTETSAYHTTLNPWDPDRVPGGSSGGAAAAVAAGAVPLALGSDTGGSIRQPAALCGVVGLRPTWGRVSRHGLVGLAGSMDAVGPLAHTVRDAALCLAVIAGADPLDPDAADAPVPDYVAALRQDLAGRSVGLLLDGMGRGVEPAVKARVNAGLAALEARGVKLRPVSAPAVQHAVAAYQLLAAAEAAALWLGEVPDPCPEAMAALRRAGVAALGDEARRRLLLGSFLRGEARGRALLDRARAARARVAAELATLLEQVDALATPTSPTVAFRFGERSEDPVAMVLADRLTTPAALAGLPALSVPVGMAELGMGDRMPSGLQLVGRPFEEGLLLAMGAAVEAELGVLPPPPPLRLGSDAW
ncbi:Asp-tRNA(Asn)/Glu-tRNA(Gln) amidotransferase subunit GatA [Myxococcota bacterium]|nr:Asp-tRNA(Asn)/Glu-tRNA(Gln) amidotransferase subunit GatA [Myxococcota bacterium]